MGRAASPRERLQHVRRPARGERAFAQRECAVEEGEGKWEAEAREEAAALREILIEAENRELREERQRIRKEEAAFEAAKIAEEERLKREREN